MGFFDPGSVFNPFGDLLRADGKKILFWAHRGQGQHFLLRDFPTTPDDCFLDTEVGIAQNIAVEENQGGGDQERRQDDQRQQRQSVTHSGLQDIGQRGATQALRQDPGQQ